MPYFNRTGSRTALILFVDDDIHMINMIRTNLESEGFRVEDATSGLLGKQKSWEIKPDLIIADIFMPGINGIEMVDMIRERPEMRDIPVIFLSGQAEGDVVPPEGADMNFSLLKKPIFLPELNLLIRRILGAV